MKVAAIPAAILAALGLGGCGPSVADDGGATSGQSSATSGKLSESTVGPCLGAETVGDDADDGPFTDGPCLSPPFTTGPCLRPPFTTGPCLGPPLSTGPCLQPPIDSSSSGSGTDTGTTGSPGSTSAPCLAGIGAPDDDALHSRRGAIERVLERGVLPPDVAKRLRKGEGT